MRANHAALLLALACAWGCHGERADLAVGLIDDAGRSVSLAAPPHRIVSLSPSITELVFAVGAGHRLVGRTRWGTYPPAAAAVPSVGDGLSPNVELIVARRPDVVLFYSSPSNATAIAQLDRLGVPSASLRLDRLDDLDRAARFIGRLTGTAARADSLVRGLHAEIDGLPRPVPPIPSVLILAWDQPPIAIGGGSYLSELVRLAGGRNCFGDLPQASASVSLETIAARDPDVVLLAGEGEPGFVGRPEWQAVRAVHERRFARVGGTEFSYPSFRAPAAVRALRRALQEAE